MKQFSNQVYHIPIMLKEVLEYLNVRPNHWYVDCNLGGGGHTRGILEKSGKVIGIDLDPDSIKKVSSDYKLNKQYIDDRLFNVSKSLVATQANFADISKVMEDFRLLNPSDEIKISGVLFDLGVSTHQLDEAERGFSFNLDAPLDMRMDQSKGISARDLVNGLYEKELAELFLKLGEETWSKAISKKIVEYRGRKLIESTSELANIILSAKRRQPAERIHPATQVFQALRIAVNDELNSLKEALPKAFQVLEKDGRIVVISFHSLEDRIVKNFFKELEEKNLGKILTDKPIKTSEEEANLNPRSRSAKLRAIKKL
ncbi:16S rRNA (cytosine(1402)-N(4))-methyltransferase RsmH [Candidatus Daviesbacteria bacterium]|nr:16S rRNA (cytosine(1402)-N(4))-methyltransferase RsmH [Candidatus Daviesbacteria bacterium]